MQKKHALLFLLISLLLPFAPSACSTAQECAKGQSISSLTLDPQGSACSSTCECNNQRYEGFCNQGICVSRKRESCSTPGERDTCTLLPTPEAGLCRTGYKLCQPKALREALWGDCSVEKLPETDDACKDGIDNDCDGKTDSADTDCAATCTSGQQSICYTGAPATVNEGRCKSGLKTCQSDGTWSACLGERTPQPKDCSNGQDNDCDGTIDKDCEAKPEATPDGGNGESIPETTTDGEACSTGEFRTCYTGPVGTVGKGPCKTGSQTCTQGVWGPCSGEVTPQKEDCQNKVDDDCDGSIDNPKELGMPCTDTTQPAQCQRGIYICHPTSGKLICQPIGETEICDNKDNDCDGRVDNLSGSNQPITKECSYSGPAGTKGVGECRASTQSCQSGTWSSQCTGEVLPTSTEAHNDKDDDCDGSIDEGYITTAAGSGSTSGFDDGPALSARFNDPQGIAVDTQNDLYIADTDNHRIRKLSQVTKGTCGKRTNYTGLCVTTVAGTGIRGTTNGAAPQARFRKPRDLTFDSKGNLYVADSDNDNIRKLVQVTNGTCGSNTNYTGLCVSTIAGTGSSGYRDGPATNARFNNPQGILADAAGNLYIADSNNHLIRKISQVTNGKCESQTNYTGLCVSTIAGDGKCQPNTTTGVHVDCFKNGPSLQAQFHSPRGLAMDKDGNLYVADTSNHRIRKISQVTKGTCGSNTNYTGLCVTTFAGTGEKGSNNGAALKAKFNTPKQLAFDSAGKLYVVATENQRIRLIQFVNNGLCDGNNSYTGYCVTTFAGTSGGGYIDGLPNEAKFEAPFDIAFDNKGNIYISDQQNHRIRRYIFP